MDISRLAVMWMCAIALCGAGKSALAETIEIDGAETAGIAGFRGLWDQPLTLKPDAAPRFVDANIKDKHGTAVWTGGMGASNPIAFDALQRSLLVRFPGAAEKIAEKINQGSAIEKAELILPFRDFEMWPPGEADFPTPTGYTFRRNWGVDTMYAKIPPQWHAIAYALRRPWKADDKQGPTFNAFINGAGYWARYGASDETHDRFPTRFGPAEVSDKASEGIDITASLTDATFGGTLGDRLRALSDQGFVINKWETYDHRFYNGAYEWGTATGGRGLLVGSPKLRITFKRGGSEKVTLKPAADIVAIAAELTRSGSGGKATAVMPSPQEIEAFTAKSEARPDWMPEWQYKRVLELRDAVPRLKDQPFWYTYINHTIYGTRLSRHIKDGKGNTIVEPPPLATAYGGWVDTVISRQPRGWSGFESGPEMTQWYLHGQYLPGPARDAIKAYWSAWLMPDRDTAPTDAQRKDFNDVSGMLIHPMADDTRVGGPNARNPDPVAGRFDTYYAKTGDWRGNKSFFRSGFNYTVSTQNFNTTAASGALLAGALLGAEKPIADGRYGFEHYPLRMWAWGSGHSQELVDHYYMAVTLSGQKAVADFAPSPFDKQMGQHALLKTIQEIGCVWHPGLKRFISGSSRTSLEYLFGKQDGVVGVMHAMSPNGALMDLDRVKLPGGIDPLGHELAPNRVALQSLAGPWAPDWQMDLIEGKPLPFEARSVSGNTTQTSYLGKNFGLSSNDHTARRIGVMAQWKRKSSPASRMEDIVTMNMRYGANATKFVNDAPGWAANLGTISSIQSKGRMLAIGSPARTGGGNLQSFAEKNEIKSLQTSIALFHFEEPRTWEVYVGDKKVDALPVNIEKGQAVTIRDGETFFAATPLDGTDLGRDTLAVLRQGEIQSFNGVTVIPTLVLDSYNYKRDQPLAKDVNWEEVDRAWSGFAVEIADASDFGGDFDRFRKHIANSKLNVAAGEDPTVVNATWTTGDDTLTMTAKLTEKFDAGGDAVIVSSALNGEPLALPKGLERDTVVDQQGRTGLMKKNGATLDNQQGQLAALMTNPQRKAYVGMIPLPDLQHWSFSTPSGVNVTGDGMLGMTKVVVNEQAKMIQVESFLRPDQETAEGVASAVLISGAPEDTKFTLNGAAVEKPASVVLGGKPTIVLPIRSDKVVRSSDEMEASLKTTLKAIAE